MGRIARSDNYRLGLRSLQAAIKLRMSPQRAAVRLDDSRVREGRRCGAGGPLSNVLFLPSGYGNAYALMSGPAVEKCVIETTYSLPPTAYTESRGTTGTTLPFTSTGICQTRLPVLSS